MRCVSKRTEERALESNRCKSRLRTESPEAALEDLSSYLPMFEIYQYYSQSSEIGAVKLNCVI